MADANFSNITGKCFMGMVLEVSGKRSNAHIQFTGYLLNVNIVFIVIQNKLNYFINSIRIIIICCCKSF